MTPKEAAQILALLTAAYPNAYKHLDEEGAATVALMWASQFSHIPYDIVFMALQKAISACKYPPTISEVKEKLGSLHWEAYEHMRTLKKGEAYEEYRRIYDLTENHRYNDDGPALPEMLQYSRQALTASRMIEGE